MTVLCARELRFGYAGQEILSGVSFQLEAGEFLGLVGPNGAGKTTLLKLVLGLLRPASGEVRVDGAAVQALSRLDVARQMALVPQKVQPAFGFPVEQVVAMGRTPYLGRFRPASDHDRRAVAEAMEVTEIENLAQRTISELSGGEQQRTSLARAFAQTTPILVLDEPTADLDLFHEFELLEQVQSKTRAGLSAIVALHDLNLAARFCDRLLVIAAGAVLAQGSPGEVLTPELLAEVFRVSARVEKDSNGVIRVSVLGRLPSD